MARNKHVQGSKRRRAAMKKREAHIASMDMTNPETIKRMQKRFKRNDTLRKVK